VLVTGGGLDESGEGDAGAAGSVPVDDLALIRTTNPSPLLIPISFTFLSHSDVFPNSRFLGGYATRNPI
jgi:hypothetical protein